MVCVALLPKHRKHHWNLEKHVRIDVVFFSFCGDFASFFREMNASVLGKFGDEYW
jgi:hypothetical protein